MKVLITGKAGMLGQKVSETLKRSHDLILTDKEDLDICDKKKVSKFIAKANPDFVINCAAYTAVEKAEDEIELCHRINCEGADNVAGAADKAGAVMIHISTDYVFDGHKKTPYLETDQVNPQSSYGKSKLEGERAVSKHCQSHYIIRTSWLFGEIKTGKSTNFVEKMLELSEKNSPIRVVSDQIGSPTYTGDLAELIARIIDRPEKIGYGIYNFSGKGEASWYDFAKEIFKIQKREIKIEAVPTDKFPSNVNRPPYSYLDKTKIEKALNFEVRPWQKMLRDYLKKTSSDTGRS